MMLVSQLSISGIIYQFVLHIQELNRNLRVDEKYMDGVCIFIFYLSYVVLH